MKMLVFAFIMAGSLAACNNASETTANKKDSLDSIAREKKQVIDSSANERKDVIDSTTQRKKDSLDRIDSLHRADSLKRGRDTTGKH